ncbi:hypothetical protein [Allosphingosinicella humi]
MDSLLKKTGALRAEAWAALEASEHFSAFKALDDAVVALGGKSAMPSTSVAENANPERTKHTQANHGGSREVGKRISHADAAYMALKEADEPLPVGRLLESAVAHGASLRGNVLANFRSAISKDKRFRSIMRNNMYFWWFTASPVPQNWKEATDPDLLNQSVAPVSIGQEGGESHAATTS